MPLTEFTRNYLIEEFSGNKTLEISDAFKLLESTDGAAQAVTVPPDSDVTFGAGTQISFQQKGAGALTLVAGVGVTINSPGALLGVSAQFGIITIIKEPDADTWVAAGALG